MGPRIPEAGAVRTDVIRHDDFALCSSSKLQLEVDQLNADLLHAVNQNPVNPERCIRDVMHFLLRGKLQCLNMAGVDHRVIQPLVLEQKLDHGLMKHRTKRKADTLSKASGHTIANLDLNG